MIKAQVFLKQGYIHNLQFNNILVAMKWKRVILKQDRNRKERKINRISLLDSGEMN